MDGSTLPFSLSESLPHHQTKKPRSTFIFQTCLFANRMRERERGDRVRVLPSAGSTPKWLQWSCLGQHEVRSWELYSRVSCVAVAGTGPSSLAWCTARELGWETRQLGFQPAPIHPLNVCDGPDQVLKHKTKEVTETDHNKARKGT